MRITHVVSRLPILILLTALAAACEPEGTPVAFNTGVRVWIDQPLNGAVLPLGSFPLKAHARDSLGGGVQRIVFLVNTIPLGTVNTDPTQPLVSAEFDWNPWVAGQYRIQAQAFGKNGPELSEEVVVCVGSSCSPATPDTPSAGPTALNVMASPTFTLPSGTGTPVLPRSVATTTPTRTRIPPTRTFTPVPPPPPPPPQGCTGLPNIASFSASPTTITTGGPATLNWGAVTNADSVTIEPGIGGVASPGSRSVSPGGTTTYTLVARCGNNTSTRQVTLTVQQPPPPAMPTRTPTTVPPQPPAAPSGLSLKNRACSTPDQVQITWSDNSNNETGFAIYRRVRNTSSIWSAWALRANVGSNTTQFTDTSGFVFGNRLEYYVQATNGAGTSAQSNTLSVFECPG